MDPNRLAVVRTKWDSGSKVYGGTAYLVHEKYLLTAHHVVFRFGIPSSVAVRFHGTNEDWIPIDRKKHIHKCEAAAATDGVTGTPNAVGNPPDILILELDVPRTATKPVTWKKLAPLDWVNWSGAGFLVDASKTVEESLNETYTPLEGRIGPPRKGEYRLPITVKEGVKSAGNWSGMSGGPVFVGNELLACIVEAPEKFEGNQFKADIAWPWLPPWFQVEFENEPFKMMAMTGIVKTLESEYGDGLLKVLRTSPKFKEKNIKDTKEIACYFVCAESLQSILSIIVVELIKGGSASHSTIRSRAFEIAEWLLFARAFEVGSVHFDDNTIKAPEIASWLLLDVIRARQEGVRVRITLEQLSKSPKWRGRTSIALPLESGISEESCVRQIQKTCNSLYPTYPFSETGNPTSLQGELSAFLEIQRGLREHYDGEREPYVVDVKAETNRELFDKLLEKIPDLPRYYVQAEDSDEAEWAGILFKLSSIAQGLHEQTGDHDRAADN